MRRGDEGEGEHEESGPRSALAWRWGVPAMMADR